MIHIDFKVESRYSVNRDLLKQTVITTLAKHNVVDNFEVSLSVCGERKMRSLHRTYMNDGSERGSEDELHDVLSFPLEGVVSPDGILYLGDIVICQPVAVSEAIHKNITLDEEMAFLVEHSCLHLLGIHHE